MYPIKKSNKPPYIYWRKLVILGVLLLVAALPLATYSHYSTLETLFKEEGTAPVEVGVDIPHDYPEELLIEMGDYYTLLTMRASNIPSSCGNVMIEVLGLGTDKSYVLGFNNMSSENINISAPIVEAFRITSVSSSGHPCEGYLSYTYRVMELKYPYNYLAYVALFVSMGGATAGILGTVLFIKKKALEKAERKLFGK